MGNTKGGCFNTSKAYTIFKCPPFFGMKKPTQHSFAISSLVQGLYREGEFVCFAQKDGTKFQQHILAYAEIEAWLLRNQASPNLYFTPPVLINKESTPGSRDSFSKQRGFCLDLDYGTTGHKQKTRFLNEAQALCYLKSLPLKPTMVWNTGHGLQALYMLDGATSSPTWRR